MVNLLHLLAFGLLLSFAFPANAAGLPDEGQIRFASYTPATMFDLARQRKQQWAQTEVIGELGFPANTASPVPAVVLMHGSGGLGPSMQQWVRAFHEIGVATFVVDSFATRGVANTEADQSRVPPAATLADAYQALKLLAGHPRIDPARIGVMGFSRGGTVAFQTAIEPFRVVLIDSPLRFSFHIAVYAGCNQVYWSPNISRAPILNLVGEADDYTLAEPCEKLADRYSTAGAKVTTIKYPGAHHGWDTLVPVRLHADATTGAACGIVRWEIERWEIYAEKTEKQIPAAGLKAFFDACTQRGAHVGRNERAYQHSRRDVQAFVTGLLQGATQGSPQGSR